jgi:hypothetical protein
MTIKAIGTIVAITKTAEQLIMGSKLREKNWYFTPIVHTVAFEDDKDYQLLDLSMKLRDFIWYGKEQDYVWW